MAVNGRADRGGSRLSEGDQRIVSTVDRCLAEALELLAWWRAAEAEQSFAERFELSATHNRPDSSYGFFGEVPVGGRKMPVMGNVQEQFYDRPKSPVAEEEGGRSAESRRRHAAWMRRQVREFVLHYFMRISDFRQPQAFPEQQHEGAPGLLEPLGWCPPNEVERLGFGFEQLFYKTRDGEIGRFSADERHKIVDLRGLGERYEWIVVKVDIFDFNFVMAPLGRRRPHLRAPLTAASHLVVSPELILDDDEATADHLGRYGVGWGFLPDPELGFLAYGPGRFEAAFQTIHFHVRAGGEVFSRMAFIANRPKKIASILGLDPVSGFIKAANLLSGGAAARRLCISREQLERTFLVQHFTQHYNVVAGSLVTWRQIPDWLDRRALPEWVVSGVSS